MKRNDIVFICAVGVMAFALAAMTLVQAWEVAEQQASARPAAGGGAGQPRDVDVRKLKRLIETNRLSEHEALYYKPADGETVTPQESP
jgi:hypothetical protein